MTSTMTTSAVRHRPGAFTSGRLPSAETDRLFREFFVARDPVIRERLVNAHLGLAASLSSRYSSRRELSDDLQQAAMLGLLHAVDRFDPNRGVQFTTFAWATISGELKRHFRDRTWGVRVPRRVQELYLVTAEATEALTNKLGRSPTVAELAEDLGMSAEEVLEAQEARSAYRLMSIDAPFTGGDGEVEMQLGSEDGNFGAVEERAVIAGLISRLAPRERQIIRLRFQEELTQAEIAARIGISQMHVSRMLAMSLTKLRKWASAGTEVVDLTVLHEDA